MVELLVLGIRVDTVGTGKDKGYSLEITYKFTEKRVVDSTMEWHS